MKRLVSLLLVLVMITLALASCGGGDTPDVTTAKPSGNQGNTQTTSKWDDVNFNGETLYINMNEYVFGAVTSAGADLSNKFLVGPDDYTTDAVQNAVYDRNIKVLNTLGLDVKYSYEGSMSTKIAPVIEAWVLAATEDTPDIVVTMNYALIRAALSGNLRNVLDKSEANYFDFEDSHWYKDFMKGTSLSNDKLYMLSSDYFIDEFRMSFITMVNVDLYNEVFANEGGIDSFYELIEAGDWNYDELERTAQLAYIDAGTIGQKDAEDTFGILAPSDFSPRSFFYSSALDIFSYDENGTPSYVTDITELHNYTDKIQRLINQDFSEFSLNQTLSMDAFINGAAPYNTSQYLLSLEGSAVQTMGSGQAVAVIPFPKYDSDNDYQTLVSDNACGGAILMCSPKFSAASAFIQMATEESGEVFKQYYEVALKYKLSSGSGQLAILDIIKNSIISPSAFFYDNYCARTLGTASEYRTIYDIVNESIKSNTNTFSSTWEGQIGAMQGQLETTVQKFKALD